MNNKSTRLKILLVLQALVLMGCNSNKLSMQKAEESSTASSQGAQSDCNRFSGTRVSGNLFAYYTTADKRIANQVRLEFKQISSDFTDTNKKLSFSFQAYGYDEDNKIVRSNTPLSFNLEYRPGGKGDGNGLNVLSSDVKSFAATDMLNLMAKLRNDTGMTVNTIQQAFAYYDVVIKGLDATFDVLQIILTDSSGTTPVASTVSLLLTPFSVNPDTYAASHPTDLMRFHPFATALGSHRSDDAYIDAAYQLCN